MLQVDVGVYAAEVLPCDERATGGVCRDRGGHLVRRRGGQPHAVRGPACRRHARRHGPTGVDLLGDVVAVVAPCEERVVRPVGRRARVVLAEAPVRDHVAATSGNAADLGPAVGDVAPRRPATEAEVEVVPRAAVQPFDVDATDTGNRQRKARHPGVRDEEVAVGRPTRSRRGGHAQRQRERPSP